MKFYPYHYYPDPDSPPVLCEVSELDYVFMFHDESYRPKSVYGGKFVKLVEMPDPTPPANMPPELK